MDSLETVSVTRPGEGRKWTLGNAERSRLKTRELIYVPIAKGHMRKDTHLASDGLCMLGREKHVRQDLQGRGGIVSRPNSNGVRSRKDCRLVLQKKSS
jgi:hypothetical protein